MGVYKFYKNIGETPLESLNRFRKDLSIPSHIPITYAGRLDPAATGELLFLTGDDCKNKDDYNGLDKIYTAEFIFGISTDTSDLLGLLKDYNFDFDNSNINSDSIQKVLNSLCGQRPQKFHNFSSKKVLGKPLWEHSRNNNIISTNHIVTIYSMVCSQVDLINVSSVYQQMLNIAQNVNGDFRQDQIIKSWDKIKDIQNQIPIIKVNIKCSSGTYVRVLADEISEILNLPICVYSINRDMVILPKS